MAKARWGVGILAGCFLLCGVESSAQASPTVGQMLQFRPKQIGVLISTPTEGEQASCEVKLVAGAHQGSSGWMLLDQQKRPLRRFFDSDGDKRIDIWSYYKDGLEVYREVDTNKNNRPDQFRWFNSQGMKWGLDADEDGKVDSWKEISAEEVAQEALQAVLTKDYARLQALFVSESDIKGLNLPESYLTRIRGNLQAAPGKFQKLVAKLPDLGDRQVAGRVEGAVPHCVPGESIGIDKDLYRFPTRTVLFEATPKQHEWLQTGEMVKVGQGWRLLDVPYIGDTTPTQKPAQNPELQRLMDELAKLDKSAPESMGIPGPNATIEQYNRTRVGIIEQMLPKMANTEKTSWLKQIADNLAAAATHAKGSNATYLEQLRDYRDRLVKEQPKSELAGYLTFRVLWTEYAPKLGQPGPDLAKAQGEWMEKLSTFVQTYPTADDTPDALLHLAMGSEFAGKEEEAKRWYLQLASNFSNHPLAPKAQGAVRRLNLVGTKMELSGQTLNGTAFNLESYKGKVVVVYYWASYCSTSPADFTKLKELEKTLGSKGVEIVSVNLDDRVEDAKTFLQKNSTPGVQLFAPTNEGGLSSPLGTQYGIIGLPSVFLVGKDGNVISRSITINELEAAIQKAL